MDLGTRAGMLAIAAALLFIALRLHKSHGKHTRITKPASLVLSFFAGCAFLGTFVGDWVRNLASGTAGVAVAALIICAGIIIIDWALDNKPDKPAFWASFALALALVLGVSQLPMVKTQVGDSLNEVTSQVQQVGE